MQMIDGVDRCECGCKYWQGDRCVDCGDRATGVVFRKITRGLYGTGVHRTADNGCEVEIVIDKADGYWWIREAIIDEYGFDLTDRVGDCYRTLAEAKQAVVDFPY